MDHHSDHTHRRDGSSQHLHRTASRRSLTIALALTFGYMLAEVIGGLASHSLALIADAGHMVADSVAIGLALLAMWIAARPVSITRTFGFQRTEILAALLNALSLWLITAWIFYEAYRRFMDPPEVQGLLMLAVGIGGLVINLAVAWTLHRSAKESLNVEGAFLHVLGDLLGSVAVVIASVLIATFGWFIVDPIFSVIIGVLILLSSARLLWKVSHVLMEGTPAHVDLHQLCQRLEQEAGITGVHDIHAWSITTGYDAFSAHVTTDLSTGETSDQILTRLRDIASKEFGISHITIQLEASPEGCLEDHHIEHPANVRITAESPPHQNGHGHEQ
ncbi:MAG: cation diffusion facilitator family transporter [Chloroflexi bacterium]|nr:cation diffusion facilitator family transporter [Chloroflexota bacterium]MDA1219711.1 cation diffusion facilitator family transporter [Chloroflexota bacterium]